VPVRLVVTDLDNTLYDWVSFFATAFSAMVDELVGILGVDRDLVLAEFKAVHQQRGSIEHPFAILELPTVHQRFGTSDRTEVWRRLARPLSAFEDARVRTLSLYPGVLEALVSLSKAGTKVVGHTEATDTNAHDRLVALGIEGYFTRLYATEGHAEPHPDPERRSPNVADLSKLIQLVPRDQRKPNPALLLDICAAEGVLPSETCYVGDSLPRDVAMANAAGVKSIWARYGTKYDRDLWKTLVQVTHWTPADVEREAALKHAAEGTRPDQTIDRFDEIIELFGMTSVARDG
jgi:FMN phosphatase YigB (HAD superfamily)